MEDETLEMGLFSDDSPLDLNLDFLPDTSELDLDDVEEVEEEENTPPEEEEEKPSSEGTDNPSEEESPETVAKDKEGSEEGSADDSPAEIFSSFASVLQEQGLLPSVDLQEAEIKSADDLSTLIKGEIDNQVKSYLIEKLGEDGYDAIEKGISLVEYQSHQQDIQTLDSITEDTIKDNPELAKELILSDYIAQGISESKAKRLLEKTIDLGDDTLFEDAKESLESLKTLQQKRIEELAKQREREALEQAKQQEKLDNDLKNAIYNKDELIKGMKIDKGIQDRVYNSITEVVGRAPNGVPENKLMKHRRESPIDFDVRLYYLYEITNGFEDFSKVVRKQESKAADRLTQALRKNKFDTSGEPSFLSDSQSYDGILGSELVVD